MTARARLLYVVPVMPAPSGNGLAMRAAMVLDGLARDFSISLLVIPVAGAADPARVPGFVRRRTAAVVVDEIDPASDPFGRFAAAGDAARQYAMMIAHPTPLLSRFASSGRVQRLRTRFPDSAFDVVHVMRLYLVPYVRPFLDGVGGRRPACVLDLDDDEAATHERLGMLHARRGNAAEARLEAREAERYRDLERTQLPAFDRILVCSEADRLRLAERTDPRRLVVVPNAVSLLRERARRADGARRAGLLFVGSLGYFPNQDAAHFLCHDVLPLLRRAAPSEPGVRIVGSAPGAEVKALARIEGVEVIESPPALERYYDEAGMVVIPMRAGGGTRIKLLEALAHARPVVATPLGAEGIEARHGREILIADGARDFAEACLAVMSDPGLAESLGLHGRELVRRRYVPEVVAAQLARMYHAL